MLIFAPKWNIGETGDIDTGKKSDTREYIKEWYKGSVSLQYRGGV